MNNEIKINKIINNVRYKEIAPLFETIKTFTYSIIKGEVLSYFAYNEFGQCKSSDIDILITKNSINILKKILIENRFTTIQLSRADDILCKSFSHQVSPYVKKSKYGDIVIDVNFDIFWGEYTGKRVDISEFLSDTIEINIYGCKIKALQPLKSIIQLILHYYKEMNSIYLLAGHDCINYNMFKDIYYLWKNNREAISLDKLYSISS